MTEEFRKRSEQLWKSKRATASLALNFAGAILTLPSPEAATERLKKISQRLAKTATAEEPIDPPNLPEDVVPVEDDFVSVTYRALSAATLADRAIDFSNEPMLKRAVGLLDGQTVFKDHETYVDNWVGRVDGTSWDAETKGLPPGINANLKLDSVKDPMTVRGVLQGALHSVSVTVSFEWKPSHPKLMDEHNFWNNLGIEVDGEMVRIVVTRIEKFWEISLVWQGADQYAKQIGADGKVVHMAANHASLAHASEANHKQESTMDILELLKKHLGLGKDVEVTSENVEQLIGKHTESYRALEQDKFQKSLDALTKSHGEEVTKLTAQIDSLTKQVAADKGAVELGKKYLEDERKEAIRLCKLVKGAEVSPAILASLEKSELDVVQAFKGEFAKEFEKQVPLQCKKCGGKDVSRQSSDVGSTGVDGEGAKPLAINPDTNAKLNDLHS